MSSGALLRPPEPLAAGHDLSRISNGIHPSIDEWLLDRARPSECLSARTYVVCTREEPDRMVGYFKIAMAVRQCTVLPSARLRRGMPDRVPLLLIGSLGVDAAWQRRRLGSMLLADALRRCLLASTIVGVRAILAHAIDDTAAVFYERHGFLRSLLGECVILMPIEAVREFAREA